MIHTNKLKAKIVELGLTVEQLATEIGMNKATLYRKLNNIGIGFTIREAGWIYKRLGLTQEEAIAIFFADNVA